jgi:hypothetical protein
MAVSNIFALKFLPEELVDCRFYRVDPGGNYPILP